jgi:hypothetical protein
MLMGGGYADRMGRWRWSNNRMARILDQEIRTREKKKK